MWTDSAWYTTEGDEGQTAGSGSDLSCGIDRYCDEEPRSQRQRLVVHYRPTATGDDEVEVLDAIIEVVVPHGLCFGR